jgi:hypothetical protein
VAFYEDGLYHLRTKGRKVTSAQMVEMYADWVGQVSHRRAGRLILRL